MSENPAVECQPRHHSKLRILGTAAVGVGLCLLLIGALIGYVSGSATGKQRTLGPTPVPAHPYTLPVTGHTASTGSTGSSAHVTPPHIPPRHVSIPSLGVTAPLLPESISDNQLGIPSDVHNVGIWSGGGSITGTQGTVLLAGHVNWWNQGNGALYDLASLKAGATIYVSATTGTETAWQAVSLHSYLKADLPQTIFDPSGPRRLVLVTCGGAFDPTTGHYADNVVAIAAPAPTSPSSV